MSWDGLQNPSNGKESKVKFQLLVVFAGGVACNQATWGFDRSSATGKEEVAICANFSPYDKGDALEVKIVPSSNISGILVRDVRDDVAIGDTQTATFQADFQCTGNSLSLPLACSLSICF